MVLDAGVDWDEVSELLTESYCALAPRKLFNVSYDAGWDDPEDDEKMVGWARDSWMAFRRFATGGVYVNFAGFEDEADVTSADTLGVDARLADVRSKYDPDGLFAAAAGRP